MKADVKENKIEVRQPKSIIITLSSDSDLVGFLSRYSPSLEFITNIRPSVKLSEEGDYETWDVVDKELISRGIVYGN